MSVAPGSVFGPAGRGWARISLAAESEAIAEGLRRLAKALLEQEAERDKQVLLIVTDGADNASRTTLERLVRRLQETETVIYAVGLMSEEDRREAKRANHAIRHIVRATGGAAYFPASVDEVHAITQQVARDIRSQYILAYTPQTSTQPGFRRVRVELTGKAKRYKVWHRPGYYSQ